MTSSPLGCECAGFTLSPGATRMTHAEQFDAGSESGETSQRRLRPGRPISETSPSCSVGTFIRLHLSAACERPRPSREQTIRTLPRALDLRQRRTVRAVAADIEMHLLCELDEGILDQPAVRIVGKLSPEPAEILYAAPSPGLLQRDLVVQHGVRHGNL